MHSNGLISTDLTNVEIVTFHVLYFMYDDFSSSSFALFFSFRREPFCNFEQPKSHWFGIISRLFQTHSWCIIEWFFYWIMHLCSAVLSTHIQFFLQNSSETLPWAHLISVVLQWVSTLVNRVQMADFQWLFRWEHGKTSYLIRMCWFATDRFSQYPITVLFYQHVKNMRVSRFFPFHSEFVFFEDVLDYFMGFSPNEKLIIAKLSPVVQLTATIYTLRDKCHAKRLFVICITCMVAHIPACPGIGLEATP